MMHQHLQVLSSLPNTIPMHLTHRIPVVRIALACCCLLASMVQPAIAEQKSRPNYTITSQRLSDPDISDCLAQLDATVALASSTNDGDGYLESRFAELESRCPNLPHLAHNRGVLAAQARRWPEAIKHLNRSLQLDPRAAMTHRHLQQIFEHRAAQAYAKALKTPISAQPPVLALQLSTDQNADTSLSAQGGSRLHTNSTVEYELYAWWQAMRDSENINDFYVNDFPLKAIGRGSQRLLHQQWGDMQREIAFTAQDSVVIISDPLQNRTLVLLRLVGTRWKIYQETQL
ncbi:MAG: hypothetical protein ACI8UP_003430 [Porticoccaceae bacterium]|jgi:hypothetical protein